MEKTGIFGTLKLPQILAAEETEMERKTRLKKINEEMREMTKLKKEAQIEGDIRDTEILFNKEVFLEMGLI